jgi:hypothetical protein
VKKLIAMAMVACLLALSSIGCGGGDTKSGSGSKSGGASGSASGSKSSGGS